MCDFGLSELLPKDQVLSNSAKGTPVILLISLCSFLSASFFQLWMAPEVMMYKDFNEKSDVYSFGIGRISLEIVFSVSLIVVLFSKFYGNY